MNFLFLNPANKFWINLLLWLIPGLFALWLARRFPCGKRGVWWVVAVYCLVISLDKVIDLQTVMYVSVRCLMLWLRSHLPIAGYWSGIRIGLCVLYLLAGLSVTGYLIRSDTAITRTKIVSLLGLVVILCYVALRLIPPVGAVLEPPVGWFVEGAGFTLVDLGLIQGWLEVRRAPRSGTAPDDVDPPEGIRIESPG